MKILPLLLLGLFAAFLTPACHDHEHNEDDTVAPTITLEAPAVNDIVSGAVRIHGVVEDESLHEMSIVVTKDDGGAVLFSASPTVHDETSYHFDESFTPAGLTGETAVTLTITVEDHSALTTTKTVAFKVKP